jgi:putative flippase GtrA
MKVRRRIQEIFSHPWVRFGTKLGGFLAAGAPSFALAVPLNWLLVSHLHWNKAGAYGLVLVVQVTLNFFMCRWFVFKNRKQTPLWTQLVRFLSGIMLFRAADWALYTVLVSVLGFYFLAVQVANIVIFAVLKFEFARRVMERRSPEQGL